MEEIEAKKKNKNKPLIDLIYIGMSAAIITICTWIQLPIGPIPFTLQTMAVCIVSGLFGWKRGTLSVIVYIVLGLVGVPVFSNFNVGVGVILGPTGGYIIGFIFTAIIVGLASQKFKGKLWALVLFMVIGIAVCYAFGTGWFCIYKSGSEGITLAYVLSVCVVPFIIPDIAKIAIASVLVNRLHRFVK